MRIKYIPIIVITLFTILCVTVSAQTNVPRGWMDGGGESPIFPAAVDNGYIGKQVAIGTNTAVVGMALTVKGTATITHKLAVGTTTISATSALNVVGTVTATGYTGDGSGLTNVGSGNMTAATYDPQAIAGDAYDLTTHTGILPISNGGIGTNTATLAGFTLSGTTTVTNLVGKWSPRIVSMADGTSFTPTADTADINTHINTQAIGSITANAPTGSPTDGQKLILRLKTTNVQTYNWNAAYRFSASNGTVTVTSGAELTDYIGLMYNSTNSKWDVVSVSLGY